MKGFIVYDRQGKVNQNFIENNKVKIIISGAPLTGSKVQSAETIFKIYAKYGIKILANKIDGGCSLTIIDNQNQSINVIRDRIGLSPIYYVNHDGFSCSTNLGPIIKSGIIKNDYNKKVIGKYASCNFRANYGSDDTFFNGVKQVLPSNFITYKKNKLFTKKYWTLEPNDNYLKFRGKKLSTYFYDRIKDSIKNYYYAFSNEKVVVALSGGVDSGTIIGMLHEISAQRVDAVSLSYEENTEHDESSLIKFSVRDHARNWYDLKLDPMELRDDMETYYNKFDIPLATISIYGYDYLIRKISELGYKNIFTGAGGDYLQAGNYPCFLYYFADLKLSKSQLYEKEVDLWIKNHGTEEFPKSIGTVESFFKKNIDFSQPGKLKRRELFLPSGNILNKDFYRDIGDVRYNVVESYGSYLRTYFAQELFYESVPPGVDAEDMINWNYGTKMISPFFSKSLIELGWQLPPGQKIKNGINKVLSRKSLAGTCAQEILKRKQKSGFNAPFDMYIKSQLKDFALDILHSKSFVERGIYNLKKFEKIKIDHIEGRESHMMLLWQTINLELWMRAWVDN
ncbi:MAG: hypothetical protein CMF94_02900 [Candidatus Marinimicrobia bacterium]|nr:hypothetical protein [Candidatus Neomarinimicrobiota bacterium]